MHRREVGHIPCAHYYATGVGIVADVVNCLCYLVNECSVIRGPRTPLVAVDMAKVAVRSGPLVPYTYAMLLQVAHVGIAAQKPEQLVYDGAQMQFLGGKQGESIFEVKTHLVAEHTACAGTCTVRFVGAVLHYVSEQVEVLFHEREFF